MNPQSTDKITEDTKALNYKILSKRTVPVTIRTDTGYYYQIFEEFKDLDIGQQLPSSIFTTRTVSGVKYLYKDQGRLATNTYPVSGSTRLSISTLETVTSSTSAITAYLIVWSLRVEI